MKIIGILVMKRLKKVRMEVKQMEREIIRMILGRLDSCKKTMNNVS